MDTPAAERSNRPPSDAFRQQKLRAWQPIMTPLKVVIIFFIIGISFIPTGNHLLSESNDIYEQTILYDGEQTSTNDCAISTMNQGRMCNVTFAISEDVPGPVNVYYELRNFYQNHRRYVSSVDYYQISGSAISESSLDTTCVESVTNGSQLLNPCGLIANSFFTDSYMLNGTQYTMDESDLAWSSDSDKFKQPEGFAYAAVPCNSYSTCESVNLPSDCKSYNTSTDCYKFHYPSDDTVQYLYETYPGQISPLDGVTDQHFKIWMRTAALPRFRKLYGRIHSDLKKGDRLTFFIENNYEVSSYSATKGLCISNLGEFGARNPYLGVAYITVGSISLFFSLLFAVKQLLAPRPTATIDMLDWKGM